MRLGHSGSGDSDLRPGGRGSSINMIRFRLLPWRIPPAASHAERGDLPQVGRNLSNAPRSAQDQQSQAKKRGTPFPIAQPSWLRRSAVTGVGMGDWSKSTDPRHTTQNHFPKSNILVSLSRDRDDRWNSVFGLLDVRIAVFFVRARPLISRLLVFATRIGFAWRQVY